MGLMEWSALLGNIGKFLGAIAVVVTLVYLTRQIGEGNRETRAATTQSALDSEMFF